MLSQDYIMRQIQQFIQALNTVLAQVLKIKKESDQTDVFTYTDKVFREEFGYNVEELIEILEDHGISNLKKEIRFNNDHLEILADILYELGDSGFEDPDKHTESVSFFTYSLLLYEFIENDERTYSIDRNLKISKIKVYLN